MKTKGKRDRNQALVAALTLLGASLGISTPSDAASGATTSTQQKDETTGIWVKDQATSKQHKGDVEVQSFTVKHPAPTTSTQIKVETTSTQYKEHAPSATFLKVEVPSGTDTTSNQHKGQAPSAMFLKHNAAPVSTQQKGDAQSNQHKVNVQDISITK